MDTVIVVVGAIMMTMMMMKNDYDDEDDGGEGEDGEENEGDCEDYLKMTIVMIRKIKIIKSSMSLTLSNQAKTDTISTS